MSNSINSGHQHHSTVTNNDIELASFARANNAPGTSAAGTNAVQSPEDPDRQQEIGRIAHYLQQQFPGGDEEGGIRGLIEDRASILHNEMHLSLDDVKDMINKAHKLDRITSSVEGGMGAIGYAASSAVPKDLINKMIQTALSSHSSYLSALSSGAAGGFAAVGMKALSQKFIENGLKDTKWMEADRDALEPAMQRVMDNRNTHGHQLKHAMMGGMGFNARNVVTNLVVGPALHSADKSLSYKQGIAQNLPATLGAGALSGVIQNTRFANKLHGPEFLLGRTDWRDRCEALLNTSVKKQMASGTLARGKEMMGQLITKENTVGTLKNLISPVQWAEALALGAGLGGTDVAMLGMRSAMGSGTASYAAQQAIGLLPSALSYAAQGVAGTETNRLMNSLFGTGKSKDKGKGPAEAEEEAVIQPEDRTNRMSAGDTQPPADIEASGSGVETPPNEPETAKVATSSKETNDEVDITGEDMRRLFTQQEDETSEIPGVKTASSEDAKASGSGVKTPPNESETAKAATSPKEKNAEVDITGEDMHRLFTQQEDETSEIPGVKTASSEDAQASGSGVKTPPNESETAKAATSPKEKNAEVDITGEDMRRLFTQQEDETSEIPGVKTASSEDAKASGSGVKTPPNESETAKAATSPKEKNAEVDITGEDMHRLFTQPGEDRPSPTTQQRHSSAPETAVPHPAGETILARDLQRQHSARFGDPFDNASLPTRPAPARLREDRNALHLQNMLNQQASERLSGSDLTDSVVTKPPRAKLRD